MGFREAIEKSPAVTASVVAVIVVGAIVFSVYNLGSGTPGPQTKAYFSDDDGKTWFVDSVDKVVPFDHNGKPAVMAKIFTCDDRKTNFVGYLVRYSPNIQKRLLASQATVANGGKATLTITSTEVVTSGTEVKRPGEATWVRNDAILARRKVLDVACPSGGVLDSVVP